MFTFAQNKNKNVENIKQDSGHIEQSFERTDFYLFAILHKKPGDKNIRSNSGTVRKLDNLYCMFRLKI